MKTSLCGAVAAFLVSACPLRAQSNTPPTVSTVANQFIAMNTATATLNVTIGDAQTPASKLVLTAWGSNPVLTPVGSIVLGGSGPTRTVKITPAANQADSYETITLVVTDAGGLSTSSSFSFTVTNATNANTAPVISTIPKQVIARNTDTGALAFVVSDNETAALSLTVKASSSNTALVPVSGIVFGGKGSARTVTVTPAANKMGTANITLTVSDGALSTSMTFAVTIIGINTKPMISTPANLIVTAGTSSAVVNVSIADAEKAAGSLTFSAKSSNSALLPASALVLGGSGKNRKLTLNPVKGQTGAATVTLAVSDGTLSTSTQFIFAVHDPALPANAFARPTGIFALDSSGGTLYTRSDGVTISLRDAGIRTTNFVDGYVLRVAWDSIEMAQGVYDFTIIDNMVSKLPKNQKLSVIIMPQDPAYIAKAPGVITWVDTKSSPSVARAVPWDPFLRARRDVFLQALASHVVAGGGAFADWPQLSTIDPYLAGGFTGIRDPAAVALKDMPGYTRAAFLGAVQDELRTLVASFPAKFVQIGFWNVTDKEDVNYGGLAAWQYIRQQLLAEFDGVQKPRVGFFQENLAAGRESWGLDPLDGRPLTAGIAQPIYESQTQTWSAFQALGSWIAPFNFAHLDNTLYGTIGEGMEFGFNTFGARYFEIYTADLDSSFAQAEIQRWHDFLAALPGPSAPVLKIAGLTRTVTLTPVVVTSPPVTSASHASTTTLGTQPTVTPASRSAIATRATPPRLAPVSRSSVATRVTQPPLAPAPQQSRIAPGRTR